MMEKIGKPGPDSVVYPEAADNTPRRKKNSHHTTVGTENKSRDQTYTRHVSAASCLYKNNYVTHTVSLDARVRFDRTGATNETQTTERIRAAFIADTQQHSERAVT